MIERIKYIVRDIDDEIIGAQHYAKLFKKFREKDPEASRMYATMAKQELGHADMLMESARRICAAAPEEENKAAILAIMEIQEDRTNPWILKVKGMLEAG